MTLQPSQPCTLEPPELRHLLGFFRKLHDFPLRIFHTWSAFQAYQHQSLRAEEHIKNSNVAVQLKRCKFLGFHKTPNAIEQAITNTWIFEYRNNQLEFHLTELERHPSRLQAFLHLPGGPGRSGIGIATDGGIHHAISERRIEIFGLRAPDLEAIMREHGMDLATPVRLRADHP